MRPRYAVSRLASVFVAALVVTAAGCSSLNPFSSSAPKPAELVSFQPSVNLEPLWQARAGKSAGYAFVPAVVGENVYAAGHDGTVYGFRNGATLWSTNVGARLSAGVGSDGRLAVVVTTGGEVVALDAQSGAERWRAPVGAEVLAAPVVGTAAVVVRASDSRLIGFAPADGNQRWVYQRSTPALALRSVSGIALEETVAVVGYPGGKIAAINTENGGPLWELTVAIPRGVTELERVADVVGTPVLGRREVCAVTFQGRIACFDLSNGSTVWARDFSSSTGMDRDTRFVVVTDDRDAVHGLDAFSGASVWKQDAMPRRALTRPLIVGDYVVVGDLEGYVHVLDRERGSFAARARTDSSAIMVPPQRMGTRAFVVQTRDGGVHVFEPK
ncbi:MAG: outer membrane protein assembly factor BamB [Rhodocyclaceae bacterium]